MRKLLYIIATFSACYIFGLGDIWLGFTSVLLLMSLFKFRDSFLWEIPLAVLSCSVLTLAFADDIKLVVQILILISTVVISYTSPRRLAPFFLISAIALFFENSYSVAFIWATLWYGVSSAFGHFITKRAYLQEYKS